MYNVLCCCVDCSIRVYCCLGIIYCFSCKDTEQLSDELRANGIKSACYHANLTPEARTQAHSQWLHNTIQVKCFGITFGI